MARQIDFLLGGIISPKNGRALSNGKVYITAAGTNTPSPVYRDALKTDLLPYPIILDEAGSAIAFSDVNGIDIRIVDEHGSFVKELLGLSYGNISLPTNHIENPVKEDIDADGHTITNILNPVSLTDVVNLQTLEDYKLFCKGSLTDFSSIGGSATAEIDITGLSVLFIVISVGASPIDCSEFIISPIRSATCRRSGVDYVLNTITTNGVLTITCTNGTNIYGAHAIVSKKTLVSLT
jgi:hypothetical protein